MNIKQSLICKKKKLQSNQLSNSHHLSLHTSVSSKHAKKLITVILEILCIQLWAYRKIKSINIKLWCCLTEDLLLVSEVKVSAYPQDFSFGDVIHRLLFRVCTVFDAVLHCDAETETTNRLLIYGTFGFDFLNRSFQVAFLIKKKNLVRLHMGHIQVTSPETSLISRY